MERRNSGGQGYWRQQGLRFPRSFRGAPSTELYREEEKRLFRSHLGNLAGKRLLKLDLWNEAQNTEILFWAAEQRALCYGIDIAEPTVRKARARGEQFEIGIHVSVADMGALPFPDGSFDCVYTMGTIEHVPDPAMPIAEITRVLKPGGTAVVGVPHKLDPFLFWAASGFLQAMGRYPYGYERWYTNRELRAQLEAQNLQVVQRDGIMFFPWFLRMLDMLLWVYFPAGCRLTDAAIEPFRRLARGPALARRFGYLTVCVARKPECRSEH